MRRYLHGWSCWFEGLRNVRTKDHGAGPLPWRYALMMAGCYRFLADGQHRRPPRVPLYVRR